MRYVCPKDVKKMLLKHTRSAYWKKWVTKHEYEELKEGIWLEPALALLRKKRRKSGLKSIEKLQENYFWKEAVCRKDSSTLVGHIKVNVKLVTWRKVPSPPK